MAQERRGRGARKYRDFCDALKKAQAQSTATLVNAIAKDPSWRLKHGSGSDSTVHYLPAAITSDVPAMLALAEFAASRRERKKPLTKIGVRRLCRKIETWTAAEVTGAANAAVIAGWSDLYPPKNPSPTATKPKQTTPDYSQPW